MKVNDIDKIERIPLAIDYRRMYRGEARISVGDSSHSTSPIEFVLELSPYGSQQVTISFLESTDYPIVPAMKLLKEHIRELDRSGVLP